jgi:hypothetical protein
MCVYLSPLYVPTLPLYAPAYAWLVLINNYIAHPDEGPHHLGLYFSKVSSQVTDLLGVD